MPVIFDHQPINRAPGSYEFGPGNIPDGFTRVRLRLARQTTATPTFWAADVGVNVLIQDSTDGGTSWRDVCGFQALGGIVLDKQGNEAVESSCQGDWRLGISRMARILYSITGNTLVSELTLEAL